MMIVYCHFRGKTWPFHREDEDIQGKYGQDYLRCLAGGSLFSKNLQYMRDVIVLCDAVGLRARSRK